MYKIALVAFALATATPALAAPEDGPNPDWRILAQLAAQCPPGLKYAPGACVRICPGGYWDLGRACSLPNQHSTG